MKKLLICFLVCISFTASAQKRIGETVTISKVSLEGTPKPGAEVTAVIKASVESEYHLQSNKPPEPNLIPTVLSLEAAAPATAGKVTYPKTKQIKVPGSSKPVPVYEGEIEFRIAFTLKGDATLPLRVPAKLRYQSCKGETCFPPRDLKFEIPVGDGK
jgi:hypothetical protein